MTVPPDQFEELADLVWASVNDRLETTGADRLRQLLDASADNRRTYIELMDQFASLEWEMSEGGRRRTEDAQRRTADPSPIAVAGGLPTLDGQRPMTHEQLLPCSAVHYPLSTVHSFVGGPLFSYLAATAIMAAALTIAWAWKLPNDPQLAHQLAFLPSSVSPLRPIVGRITGMVDCSGQWSVASGQKQSESRLTGHRPLATGHSVTLGDKFNLASGLMEIAYDTGAKVILQGPVTYEVESRDGGFLSLGKLTARVGGEGRGMRDGGTANLQVSKSLNPKSPASRLPSPAPLFSVRTPTAIVTDLGTEFGVEVAKSGETTSHVFRGSVRVQVVGVGNREGAERVLGANESARVGGGNRQILPLRTFTPSIFVREMPERNIRLFDLVDVVAGGDGLSGRRERGIDPATGRIVHALTATDVKEPLVGDGKYHRALGLPFVDGVFIPDGAKDNVQVDSAGHFFDGFHGTVSRTWQPVWAGGPMRGQEHPTKVWGIDYNSPGHGQILLHASNAITFDLEAIRRANPGCKLLSFRATAGNSDSGTSVMGERYADFWVLVDAQPKFRRRQIRSSDGAYSVVVPIGPSDRFLTLAATDGGDDISHDWIIFGDPRLEILVNGDQRETDKAPPQRRESEVRRHSELE